MLQAHDKVSDAEAQRRATVDMSWKVALGVDAYSRSVAQSTLQCFRAQLILHEKMQEVFVRSLDLARARDLLQGRACRQYGTQPPSWAGVRPRTPTTCWRTASAADAQAGRGAGEGGGR